MDIEFQLHVMFWNWWVTSSDFLGWCHFLICRVDAEHLLGGRQSSLSHCVFSTSSRCSVTCCHPAVCIQVAECATLEAHRRHLMSMLRLSWNMTKLQDCRLSYLRLVFCHVLTGKSAIHCNMWIHVVLFGTTVRTKDQNLKHFHTLLCPSEHHWPSSLLLKKFHKNNDNISRQILSSLLGRESPERFRFCFELQKARNLKAKHLQANYPSSLEVRFQLCCQLIS